MNTIMENTGKACREGENTESIKIFTIKEDMFFFGTPDIIKVIAGMGAAKDSNEAEALIACGCVRVNGLQVKEPKNVLLKNADIITIGENNYIKIVWEE